MKNLNEWADASIMRWTRRGIAAGLAALLMSAAPASHAQESRRLQPVWWYGGSLGLNLNFHSADMTNLNGGIAAPAPFTSGTGTGLFLSGTLEYRPDPIWGGLVHLGYDGRSGSFDEVSSGGVTRSLSFAMNYITLEPSVRLAPFPSEVYLFAGPKIAFNVAKSFDYSQSGLPDSSGDFGSVRGVVFGGQLGAGVDFFVSEEVAGTRIAVSPFLGLHFGASPRTAESWGLTTIRAGVTVKVASTSSLSERAGGEVGFTVRAPRIIPGERRVKETFPIRNYLFFDEGKTGIPPRYAILNETEAAAFRVDQLVEAKPRDLTGRSSRQLSVYRNLLNVLGDRMRENPGSNVTLRGSSPSGAADGRALAESVKRYLTETFGIAPDRVSVTGTEKPSIPSIQPGATRELELLRAEDRRVEITAEPAQLLDPVEIISIQDDPLDSDILINVDGSADMIASWSVETAGPGGEVKKFGPFTSDRDRISGRQILGDRLQGDYTITITGEMKGGGTIRKTEAVRLVRSDEEEDHTGWRFSILFEFDESKTVATYNRFLTSEVAPLIPAGGSVIIHGHTDIVGEESYNLKLSRERSGETMDVLKEALARAGKRDVRFDTYGFGEDVRRAPFENSLPEERFYNRTVIIDIIPE